MKKRFVKITSSASKILLSSIIFAATGFIGVSIASVSSPIYSPGETLSPTCSPGDLNCGVSMNLDSLTNVNTLTEKKDNDLLFYNNNEWNRLGHGTNGQVLKYTTNNGLGWGDIGINITDDGNVGIGTAAPTHKLEVDGTISATSFIGDGSQLTGLAVKKGLTDGSVESILKGPGKITLTHGSTSISGTEEVDFNYYYDTYGDRGFTNNLEVTDSAGDIYILSLDSIDSNTSAEIDTSFTGVSGTYDYYINTASGPYSTAFGNSTASGSYSTTFGKSRASGTYSVSSGTSTASNNASTAFGNSIASGSYSVSGGNSTASGDYSTAFGSSSSKASGDFSTALGGSTASESFSVSSGNSTASGPYSTAFGKSRASGSFSTAFGNGSIASGSYSTALGQTIASGEGSMAFGGEGTLASGFYSTAFGVGTIASGPLSTASGYNSTASGFYSTALGEGTIANSYILTALGRYNIGGGTANSWVVTDPLFEIGIGTDEDNRANAMTVLKNGNVGIGTHTPTSKLEVIGDIKTDTLNVTELLNAPTSAPSSGAIAGSIYYDTASSELRIYNGDAWKKITLTD